MTSRENVRFDEINYWSEVKLDIVKDYAAAYSTIFGSVKQAMFHHVYIDAFAGAGLNLSRSTGEYVMGSPLNAMLVKPGFKEFHFIDLDGDKVAHLRKLVGNQPNVHVHRGDCNTILLEKIFPNVRFAQFRRGLCLLDPYGLHLDWKVTEQAGKMKTIDLFLNFPIMDMNRNVLWRNPEKADTQSIARMTAFWGDDSWRKVAYQQVETLFGSEDEKASNEVIAEAFRKRLRKIAKFAKVLPPLPMRNSKGAIVYYLFFASQKKVAENIVKAIFKKYQNRGIH